MRYVVALTKMRTTCVSCGATYRVYTARRGGTVVQPTCDPYVCRIARTLRLAGRWQDVREILPTDDRGASRQMFAGGAA